MSLKNRLAAKAQSVRTDDLDDIPPPSKYEPRTAPGQLMGLQAKVANLEKELIEARTQNQSPPQTIALDQLHEVEGRRRRLTAEQFAELKENLRQNDLITPVTVRPRAAGGFEIVSGHNRIAAYRELGRTEIEAVIRTLDDDRVVLGAFYANLLQPQLPDYEKYLGFVAIRKISPDLSPDELAEQAGISKSHVYRLLSFEDLPSEALELIDRQPDAIGSTAVFELAKHAKNGRSDAVVKAVQKLVARQVTQDEALRMVANGEKTNSGSKAEKAKPIPIKSGKEKFLTIRPTGIPTAFKLEFESAEDAAETMQAFQEWIKGRIAAKKSVE